MRKITFILWIFLLFPSIIWAQEKVEAPVWNVGEKWVFTQGNIECVDSDQNSYGMKFSNDTCALENQGFNTILFDKSTLNRIGVIEKGKQKKYTMGLRRILNFPFNMGKQWKDEYSGKQVIETLGLNESYDEFFTVLGWEALEVRAGKFRAIKLEYKNIMTWSPTRYANLPLERKSIFWYSPDVKYFIKCQYDKSYPDKVKDWELVSFKGKK